MTDGTTTTHATGAERRLVRPHDERVIAGVCSGLARYFDMSPLVYRIAFLALLLLGGAGIVLYVAAWLVIPDEQTGQSVAEAALRDHRERPWLLIGVGLVALALVLAIGQLPLWPFSDAGDVWLLALGVGLVLVWWQLSERRGSASAVARPAQPRPTAVDAEATAVARVPPAPRRPRLPIFLPTLGILIAGAGLLGILDGADVVDVDWTLALAGGAILVGLAVAVGAFFGAVGALASFGVALVALMVTAVAVEVPLRGPIGERVERPVALEELEAEYELSIGRLILDLRDVELPLGTTQVSASVGVGELIVYVPEDASVVVDAETQAGVVDVLGVSDDGWDVGQARTFAGPADSSPTLVLEADVGLGDLEVRR